MLLMSSRMTTVLPTPAPPKAPALPPLMNGQIRSMTLMPVSRICGLGVLLDKRGRRPVDRVALLELDLAAVVHGLAGDIEDAAEDAVADRYGDGAAGVDDVHAALEALGGGHRDRAGDVRRRGAAATSRVSISVLPGDRELDGERLVDGRDGVLGELDVDHGADDLDDFSGSSLEGGGGFAKGGGGSGAMNWAAAISRISWVMAAWRALLYSSVRSPSSLVGVVLGGLHRDHAGAVLGGLGRRGRAGRSGG